MRAGLALRARIVLAAADGERTSVICDRLGVSRPTLSHGKKRYVADGVNGLGDAAIIRQVRGGREAAHVRAGLGDDDLRDLGPDPGDRLEQFELVLPGPAGLLDDQVELSQRGLDQLQAGACQIVCVRA